MIYLYIDIVMLPVCTQSEKVSPSIPRAAQIQTALIPVKASNCPSVEECKNVWEYLNRSAAERIGHWEEDAVGHALLWLNLSAFLSSHDKRRYLRKIIDFISNWKLKLNRSL
jgi:hypothetical protein